MSKDLCAHAETGETKAATALNFLTNIKATLAMSQAVAVGNTTWGKAKTLVDIARVVKDFIQQAVFVKINNHSKTN